jgi:hypothetical protein
VEHSPHAGAMYGLLVTPNRGPTRSAERRAVRNLAGGEGFIVQICRRKEKQETEERNMRWPIRLFEKHLAEPCPAVAAPKVDHPLRLSSADCQE